VEDEDPHDKWWRACEEAKGVVLNEPNFELKGLRSIEAAKKILELAYRLAGQGIKV